jgi:prolyl-tRNA editing enzyme YbaK/EbsC (Cys-tRNA(Pro) deacylase)
VTIEAVRQFFAARNLELPIIELEANTATVTLAAEAHGVEPGRIAKTLAFRLGDRRVVLVVAAGDVRVNHGKFKAIFGKGKMLNAEDVVALTGHPVGGVCPFGLAEPLPVYLDQSLRAYDEVLPAAGSVNSAVRIGTEMLAEVTRGEWVDVC